MGKAIAAILLALATLATAQAQSRRETPYWASIASGQAMMRTGPGQNYPATWLYLRRDLPIRIVETYPGWRKVEDPGGETGWMLQRLLSDMPTAIVTGNEPRPMHEQPDAASKIRYRAEPGVVGRLSRCGGGWCRLDVGGRGGFIRADQIWGIGRGETLG